MPTIITRGLASARGFGFGNAGAPVCPSDGTKAIFALGSVYCFCFGPLNTTTIVNKYVYATDASTSVTGLCAGFGYGAAAGNSTVAIFNLGAGSSARRKITYSTCTFSISSAAISGFSFGSAAGNNTAGIFTRGNNNSATEKATYACCTRVSGPTFGGSNGGSAVGTSTIGIFACGNNSTSRYKVTYATCSSTNCGVGTATFGTRNGAAAGNGTIGIFALGGYYCSCVGGQVRSGFLNKYTFATNTSTGSGLCYGDSVCGLSAAGNKTRGIFASGSSVTTPYGYSPNRRKWTYATSTTTASATAASSYSKFGGATSWVTGVNT